MSSGVKCSRMTTEETTILNLILEKRNKLMLTDERHGRKRQFYIKYIYINYSGRKFISFVCWVTRLANHLLCGGGLSQKLSNCTFISNYKMFLCIDKANWSSETLSTLPKVIKLVGTRAEHQKTNNTLTPKFIIIPLCYAA